MREAQGIRHLYVFAIGGTGTRVAEALVHLAAVGMFRNGDEITIIPVEADKASGNLTRLEDVADFYKRVYESLDKKRRELLQNNVAKGAELIENREIFKPKIERTDPITLADNNTPNMDAVFAGELYEALYSKAHRTFSLQQGYRGRPSLGAPMVIHGIYGGEIFGKVVDKIKADIGADRNIHIVAVGSLMGGTGASVLPLIPYIIRREIEGRSGAGRVAFHAIFLLSYFGWNEKDCDGGHEVKAGYETFDQKTPFVVDYYTNYLSDDVYKYDTQHFIGYGYKFIFDNCAIGGENQKNPLTIVDLVAALSVLHAIEVGRGVFVFSGEVEEKETRYDLLLRGLKRDLEGKDPETLINLFFIFSVFMKAWFEWYEGGNEDVCIPVEGRGCIEDKLKRYNDLFWSIMREMHEVKANEPRIIRGKDKTQITNIEHVASILLPKLRDGFLNVDEKKDKDKLLRNYREILGSLNGLVVNVIKNFAKNRGTLSCEEFMVGVHSCLAAGLVRNLFESDIKIFESEHFKSFNRANEEILFEREVT